MITEGDPTVEHQRIEAYLEALGLDEHVPRTMGGLALVQTLHVQRIPYSTVNHFAGKSEPLEPARIIERIVETGHGGYCFELNSALFALLKSLGFDARRHLATIARQPELSEADSCEVNHMTITIHDLPTDENPDGVWITDVGLGDGPYEPLPLWAGTYQQRGFEYTLEQLPEEGSWRLWHNPFGAFSSMTFNVATDVDSGTINAAHLALVGSPTSRFVRNLILEQRPETNSGLDAVDTLVNCELKRRQGQATVWAEELTSQSAWSSRLHEIFGLSLDEFSDDEKMQLWERVVAVHSARRPRKTHSRDNTNSLLDL